MLVMNVQNTLRWMRCFGHLITDLFFLQVRPNIPVNYWIIQMTALIH